MRPKIWNSEEGFSLIEMGMTLVVIGFIAGGILAGQHLYRSSQLNTVLKDFEKYTSAVGQFKDKYSALPGDMNNATSFWGTDAGCTMTPNNTEPKTPTCNGNGNWQIGAVGGGVINYEVWRGWQHLANAGMIPGSYTGALGPAPNGQIKIVPGYNAPPSPLTSGGGGYVFGYMGNLTGHVNFFDGNYGNTIGLFGGGGGAPVSSSAELLSLEEKIDDTLPGYGKLRGPKQSCADANQCTTSDVPATARYDMTSDAIRCHMLYVTGY